MALKEETQELLKRIPKPWPTAKAKDLSDVPRVSRQEMWQHLQQSPKQAAFVADVAKVFGKPSRLVVTVGGKKLMYERKVAGFVK